MEPGKSSCRRCARRGAIRSYTVLALAPVMRLFTRDSDGKPDTPLSVWVGLLFVGIAVLFEAMNIGPGGFRITRTMGKMGINMFFLIVGLSALVPGLFLTLLRDPTAE